MSLSQRDVTQLRQLLSKLSVTPAPKKRRRRKHRNGGAGVPAATTRPVNTTRHNAVNGGSDGEIVVSRTEKLADVNPSDKVTTGLVPLYPTSSVMPWLAKLVVAFDRIEWLQATLQFKPFVGTQTSGSVAFSVDWDSSVGSGSVTRNKVLSGTPVYEAPVWQNGRLPLPQKMLMSRKAYSLHTVDLADKQPGNLMWSVEGHDKTTTLGEVWITYRVRLSGTTA